MKLIDLHVHSTYSDGTFSPAELVEKKKKKGLTAFAPNFLRLIKVRTFTSSGWILTVRTSDFWMR